MCRAAPKVLYALVVGQMAALVAGMNSLASR
jgi:hypothetical protein